MMSNYVTKILIEAGAGAGKTYTLIKEIIDLLKNGKALPREIGAITFTNAAASEMKGRYQEEILKEENSPNIAAIIGEMDDLCVSTIHSFCNKILSLFPFELGTSLDRNIIIENKDIAKRNDKLFENAMSTTPEVNEICKMFGVDVSVIKNMFIDMQNSALESWKEYDDGVINYEKIEDIKKRCANCYNEVKSIIETHIKKFDRGLWRTIIKKEVYEGFYFYPRCSDFTIEEYKIINDFLKKTYKPSEEDKPKWYILTQKFTKEKAVSITAEDKQKVKEENKILKCELLSIYEKLTKTLNEYNRVALSSISNMVIKLFKKAKEEKRFMSDITNDETLLYTREVLNKLIKNKVILPESLRYKYIFIDEFQDTDPVQIDIVKALGDLIVATGTDVSFYLIGDPKQSIYQFRGADLNCYLKTSKEIEEGKKTDNVHYVTNPLKKNFRSSPIMIDYFNRMFSKERYFNVDESEFSYTLTSPGFERDKSIYKDLKVLSGVYRSDIEVQGKITNAHKDIEAEYIASLVQHYVSNGYLIYDKDVKDNVRPVQYSDFMIITPDNKQSAFLRAFGSLNISVNLEGREEPNTKEVLLLKGLLKYILDSGDENKTKLDKVYLEEVLTDKFVDDERSSEDRDKLIKLYTFLDSYKNKTVGVFIEEVQTFISSLGQSDNKEQIVQVIEMLKSGTLSSYDEAYKSLIDINEINRRLRLNETTNAVKVINLHKSKGLQGGIVILGGHIRINNNQPKTIGYINIDGKKEGIFNIYSRGKGSQKGNLKIHLKSEEMENYKDIDGDNRSAESKRLMYVAATRAKEMLIILNHKGKEEPYDGYWKDLLDDSVPPLPSDQSIENIVCQKSEEKGTETPIKAEGQQYYSFITKNEIAPLLTKGTPIINPSKLKGIKEDKTDITEEDTQKTEQFKDDYTFRQPLKGTIIHAVFEKIINLIKSNEDRAIGVKSLLENDEKRYSIIKFVIISTLLHEEEEFDYDKIVSANIDELDKYLKSFLLDSEIQSKIQKARHVYTELPFEYRTVINDKGSEGTQSIVKGIMDLVLAFDKDDLIEYEIWDYKTTENAYSSVSEFEEHLYSEYNEQLMLYKKALYDIFSQKGEKINVLPPKIYHLYR